MQTRKILSLASACALTVGLLTGAGIDTVRAAVTAAEAARLGAELTPLGAEKAGNAAGTIPAWEGGLSSAAKAGFPDFKSGGHHPDPYANDKPLFTITAANMNQYAEQLTEGHKALLQAYKDRIWLLPVKDSRKLVVTPRGRAMFVERFGLERHFFQG